MLVPSRSYQSVRPVSFSSPMMLTSLALCSSSLLLFTPVARVLQARLLTKTCYSDLADLARSALLRTLALGLAHAGHRSMHAFHRSPMSWICRDRSHAIQQTSKPRANGLRRAGPPFQPSRARFPMLVNEGLLAGQKFRCHSRSPHYYSPLRAMPVLA
ncbi:hypothetical protein IQ07DRAFT_9139 [Pyrenochaeta sp. DS3sAY3a]|nr:hypothetical protein IQ07DRAFT_9139 [Pyrenochaeta sp. DS3sAY3a]